MKVSGSRTGQEMCILKLAPRLVSKRQGELIGRQGEQVGEFPHQISFRQTLRGKGERGLMACELPQEAALLSIEVQFEHVVAPGHPQIVIISPKIEPPVGSHSSKPAAVCQVRKDPIQVEHLGFPFWAIRAT